VRPRIAILGGTGALGSALARRWARAGFPVIVASRSKDKALESAAALQSALANTSATSNAVARIEADALAEAAARAAIAVLAVPYSAHRATLESVRDALAGKVLVDTTVPLRPPKVGTVQLPPAGCAAVEAQQLLGPGVRVVSAFQNVAAAKLATDAPLECDVLVSGDDVAARDTVIGLVEAIGVKAWPAGPLANSAAAEALTSVIIQINRKFGVKGAGIRIVLGEA
jgi:hypothetical protein